MDITTVFGTVILGSNPGRCTLLQDNKPLRGLFVGSIYKIGRICGYGLVVECVLAKDETRVRFSLPAHNKAT